MIEMSDTETSDSDKIAKIFQDLLSTRKTAIDRMKCPMCSSMNWDSQSNTILLPKNDSVIDSVTGKFIVSIAECHDITIKHTCNGCGFIALFKLEIPILPIVKPNISDLFKD